MKHTEEEAREKWCPWARYAEKQNGLLRWAAAVNRWFSKDDKQHNPEHARCIGSACMGWVWTDKEGHPKRKGMCGYLTNINVNAHFAVPQQQRPPLIGRG